jgi:hypothetical protein
VVAAHLAAFLFERWGKLDNCLGIQASPSNPLSAWLHATHVLDPKAMGYWVFQADLGETALGTSSGTGPLLKLNSTLPPAWCAELGGNHRIACIESARSGA